MTSLEYIRYRITDPARRAAFEEDYATAATHLDRAPECLGYELSNGVEEPERYVLRIEWSSVADHEQGFRGGPHFPPFLAAIRPYIGDIEEMKHYARTAVVSARAEAASA
ncbi:antibiotic biosynthesis monooxygenase family protein [Streptomyces hoynatensis]|uniref:Antibiotic biosynthesis monooxygenase n=1 Tax=Streptomyces hoynatensis TaxID=1141874 RepID=A0A3A9Z5J6_9ACTN|nr:antibiotic biosynthesis monooxygenase family protein [Streptomyces hoynatensis]RKN43782.1 antibiotic biosynthesis monooxygenase [Streptomyces hoynatensis]